ncbi:hypothetical protein L5D93_22925 [Paenibacillus thiaminolyticus]|nr:hypothetical protein [Paenibacillus thiaminolyticus]
MLASRPYCRSEISNQTYSFVAATGKFAVRGIDRSDGRFDSFLYTSVAPVSWNMHPESQCASDPFRAVAGSAARQQMPCYN